MSSCLGLVRTAKNRGCLYAMRARGLLYPTQRLLSLDHRSNGMTVVGPAHRTAPHALKDFAAALMRAGDEIADIEDDPHRPRPARRDRLR